MKITELFYLEISNPNPQVTIDWLQQQWQPSLGKKIKTIDGIRLELAEGQEISIFVWTLQRTTYLKVFRWGEKLGEES